MRTTKQVEGIIFNTFDCKDNDVIVDVLTKDDGFIKVYVKGAKKIKNKNFFTFKIFNQVSFTYHQNNNDNLGSASNTQVLKIFNYTLLDYDNMNFVSLVSELLLKIKENYQHNVVYYDLVILLVKQLQSKDKYSFNYVNYFIYESLALLGSQPVLDKCCICGNTSKIIGYSLLDNGFVCSCSNQANLIKDELLLKYLYYLNQKDFIKLEEYISSAKKAYQLLYKYLVENSGLFLISHQYIIGGK